MSHTNRTLKLNHNTWDLSLNGVGGISTISSELATAQNVANEVRLFMQDAYFMQDFGIPHFVIELGQRLTPSMLKLYIQQASMRVPDVVEILSVSINVLDKKNRQLSGAVKFKTATSTQVASISTYF